MTSLIPLRERLARILPKKETLCPDPQCEDSTWDHDCQAGPSKPNWELVDRVVVGVRDWLYEEADDIAAHHEGERGNRHRPIVKHLRWLADSINEELNQ